MSVSLNLCVVYGVEVPYASLVTTDGNEWRCRDGHVQSGRPRFCPECGRECNQYPREVFTALAKAWAESCGADLGDGRSIFDAMEDAKYHSTGHRGAGLYAMGEDIDARTPPKMVLGIVVNGTFNGDTASAVSVLPTDAITQAGDFVASLGLSPADVRLHVAAWLS